MNDLIAPLLTPKRVRVAGLAAMATDAAVVSGSLTGPVVAGGKIGVDLVVRSMSGGLVQCSGVVAYPNAQNVVIGHFGVGSGIIPAGGTGKIEMRSLGVVSQDYVGQNLELLFITGTSLSGVPINTPTSQLSWGWETVVAVGKGTLFTSPYFIPGAVAVGALGVGALGYELTH